MEGVEPEAFHFPVTVSCPWDTGLHEGPQVPQISGRLRSAPALSKVTPQLRPPRGVSTAFSVGPRYFKHERKIKRSRA